MNRKTNFDQQEALKSLAEGDELIFAQIFERYHPKVYRLGYDFFHNRELAQELVQDVFIKVWERRTEFADVRTLEAFIHTMAKNMALNVLKSRSREVLNAYTYSLLQERSENSTENIVLNREFEQVIKDAVESLSPQQRRVYELSREQGLSHSDIAEQLKISDSTVNNLMTKAVGKLRKNIEPYSGLISFFIAAIAVAIR